MRVSYGWQANPSLAFSELRLGRAFGQARVFARLLQAKADHTLPFPDLDSYSWRAGLRQNTREGCLAEAL